MTEGIQFPALFSLEGRVALVTGGSRGIGHMIVDGLLAAGCARVYITARKKTQLEEAEQRFNARFPGRVIGLPGDLSDMGDINKLVDAIAHREVGLDILVNNAGAAWGAPLAAFPESGWDKVMDLNAKSVFFLTQKLLPLLKAAAQPTRPAKIITIASVDGLRPNFWDTYSYQASKAAVIHLTRRLAAELIQDHVIASCIAPGAFPSEMNKAAEDTPESLAAEIPARRIGAAEDMAGGVIYLASRAGDYVVGTTLPIDGGLVNADF